MKNALIIHGACSREEYFDSKFPSLSNSHWFPWLQKQLLIKNILTQSPEMPEPYKPDYTKWKKEFERYDSNKDSTLIGHSCGGGFLVRWLSENRININKLILVAPWLDPVRENTLDFFEFLIDPLVENRVREIHLFVSSDDEKDVLKSVEIIHNSFKKINIHNFNNKGHFTFEEMGTSEFPELLDLF